MKLMKKQSNYANFHAILFWNILFIFLTKAALFRATKFNEWNERLPKVKFKPVSFWPKWFNGSFGTNLGLFDSPAHGESNDTKLAYVAVHLAKKQGLQQKAFLEFYQVAVSPASWSD